jgi:zinc and cadmium transporter
MEILLWIIAMTFLNGLIAFAGAFSLLMSKEKLNKITVFLVALAIGALLGGAFFHFIPESLEKMPVYLVVIFIFLGITLFYLIEKYLHWHHCHKNGKCETHPYTKLILYGDGVHNFIDGLIIASSFIISIPLGILTSLLVMAHELPQEIGDFGVLIYGGYTRKKALLYNFISQLTAVFGGILGYFFLGIKDYAIYVLPFAAGGFLYIAINDLIPEVFKEKSIEKKILNLLFIIIGIIILISAKLLLE